MKKIFTVIGARPQFIKAASVSKIFGQAQGVTEVLIHTGQHHDSNMSKIFFDQLQIKQPTHHLGVHGGSHGEMTARMLIKLEKLFSKEAPDAVLVYGDTNTTISSALAAAKLNIPVVHVEAGLRSFNRCMPEEINRILTDHVSSLLLTPTTLATENLLREGLNPSTVVQVGDVMYDSMLYFQNIMPSLSKVATDHDLKISDEFILATIHRQENTDDPIRLHSILSSLAKVACHLPVVLPLHPRTYGCIVRFGFKELLTSIQITSPLGFLDMLRLQSSCSLIATDSGGVQKEAFFHRKPCITLRDETEWVELVDSGWNHLSPPLKTDICSLILNTIGTQGGNINPYGNGDAALKVVHEINRYLHT